MAAAAVASPAREVEGWRWETLLALARPGCCQCFGGGAARWTPGGRPRACDCVLRRVCEDCLRWNARACDWRKWTKDRRDEEYAADLYLAAKRVLGTERWRLFRLYFDLGWDSARCCRELRIDRGNFYHELYVIAATLGREFHDVRPYALYPPREYFAPITRR
jgi:hypothetical protein